MLLTSVLRTIVPALWALLISWLLLHVPMLEPLRDLLMEQSDVIVIALQGAIIGAWYAFTRWLEPKLPDWLSRILMGSASQPTYDKPEPDQEVIHDEPESDQEVTYGLGN